MGYSVSLTSSGRYGNEKSMLYVPRKPDPAKRAIIYAHGANGDGAQTGTWSGQSSLCKFFGTFALAGFVILSGDWGGPHTYGNDTEMTMMDAGWEWLRATGLCASDKVILTGGSMGFMSISRWAADNESEVAGMNAWIPAANPDALRNTDALGLRNLINTAWGLAANSYPAAGGALVPDVGNPITRAAELNDVPTHLWYSSGDTATLAADVLAYANARTGVTLHEVSTTLNHSDAAIGAADGDAILAFFESIAYAT